MGMTLFYGRTKNDINLILGGNIMTVVGILGTVHGDEENRKKLGYPLELMKKAILDFKPDVICGEVRPEDWQKYCGDKSYSGYLGPFEYRFLILPLCKENNISFEPVDWFEDDLVNYQFDIIEDKEKEEYEKKQIKLFEELLEKGKQSPLPFNSFEFDRFVEGKHKYDESMGPIEYLVTWEARNYLMVRRIKAVIEKYKDKRILCTVGAEHNYFYHKELKKLDLELVYPLK